MSKSISYFVNILGLVLCMSYRTDSVFDREDVRLADGIHPFEGRVEIFYRNEWRTGWTRVCMPYFNMDGADTICRVLLGISAGAMSVWSGVSDLKQITTYSPTLNTSCVARTGGLDGCMTTTYSYCYSDKGVRCNLPGYLGCFPIDNDMFSFRCAIGSTAGQIVQLCSRSSVDVTFCIGYCREKSYAYARVSDGAECLCAREVELTDMSVSNEQCDLNCGGDVQYKCGSSDNMGVYQTSLGSCGSSHSSLEGVITSPKFPGPYSDPLVCDWFIDVPRNYTIRLTTLMMHLSNSDYIKVYESNGETHSLDGNLLVRSNSIKITLFHTDTSQGMFLIKYQAIENEPVTTATTIPITSTAVLPTAMSESSNDGLSNISAPMNLNTGVIVAIVVGILLVIVVVILIILIVRRKKKKVPTATLR